MAVRRIKTPSVDHRAVRAQKAAPFSGKRLGVTFVEGYAEVDESRTHTVHKADGGTIQVPIWQTLIHDFGYVDVTPPPPEPEPEPSPPPEERPRPQPALIAAGSNRAR